MVLKRISIKFALRMKWIYSFCLVFFAWGNLMAQDQDSLIKQPVQFSGVTASEDGKEVVPFITILVKNRYKGTISNVRGFFSFVVLEGDTIQFSAVGYKAAYAVIPKNIPNSQYSIIQLMEMDTIQLDEVEVYPWPSKEAFKDAFLDLQLPGDEIDIAARNLQNNMVRELVVQMGMDASENQRYFIKQQINQMYYAGSQPNIANVGNGSVPIPSSLLNPIAWSKFIKALKNGDFKQK